MDALVKQRSAPWILHYALLFKENDFAARLVSKRNDCVNSAWAYSKTPLLLAASEGSDVVVDSRSFSESKG